MDLAKFLSTQKGLRLYHGSDAHKAGRRGIVEEPTFCNRAERMMDSDAEYKATLQMLVPMVIQVIMERRGVSVVEAVKLLYLSRLYSVLERESTKVWHFSPLALYEFLEMELETGKLVFPGGV